MTNYHKRTVWKIWWSVFSFSSSRTFLPPILLPLLDTYALVPTNINSLLFGDSSFWIIHNPLWTNQKVRVIVVEWTRHIWTRKKGQVKFPHHKSTLNFIPCHIRLTQTSSKSCLELEWVPQTCPQTTVDRWQRTRNLIRETPQGKTLHRLPDAQPLLLFVVTGSRERKDCCFSHCYYCSFQSLTHVRSRIPYRSCDRCS